MSSNHHETRKQNDSVDVDDTATNESDATNQQINETNEHELADELTQELESAKAKAEENWNLLLAAKAETDNIRKRAERDVQNAHKYALEKFIPDLLAVKDSLELGMDAAEKADSVEKFLEGSELTLKQLNDSLNKHGVVEINPLGEKLDPELHQAVSVQPSDEYGSGVIIQVIQKGFTLNDRLIRPAMVIVAQ